MMNLDGVGGVCGWWSGVDGGVRVECRVMSGANSVGAILIAKCFETDIYGEKWMSHQFVWRHGQSKNGPTTSARGNQSSQTIHWQWLTNEPAGWSRCHVVRKAILNPPQVLN